MRKGYTLLEMILVIAIVTILSGVTFAKYRDILYKARLEKNVAQMIDQISLARNRTLSKDLSPLPSCSPFAGYTIKITSDITYTVSIRCGLTDNVLNTYTTDKTIFTTVGTTFNFVPPLAQLVSSQTITVKETVANKCASITIEPVGTISTTTLATCL